MGSNFAKEVSPGCRAGAFVVHDIGRIRRQHPQLLSEI
jgi:hypothetical protein